MKTENFIVVVVVVVVAVVKVESELYQSEGVYMSDERRVKRRHRKRFSIAFRQILGFARQR